MASVKLWNDWDGLLMPWTVNWVDFTVFQLTFEWDKRFGNAEMHLAVLGVHFDITVNLGEGGKEFQDELKAAARRYGFEQEESDSEKS